MTTAPPTLTTAAALALSGLLTVVSGDARADEDSHDGLRMAVMGSVTTSDALTMTDGTGEFIGARPPGFGLDVSLAGAVESFELGLLLSVVSSGSTPGVGTTQRLYAQTRATAYLRWSYVLIEGFDIYTGLGIGVAATRLSDFVRFEIARDARAGGLDEVAPSMVGLAVDVEIGMRIPLDDDGLRLIMSFASHTAEGEVKVAGERASLFAMPARFHAGLEWRL